MDTDNTKAKAVVTAIMWLSYLAMIWLTIPLLGTWAILLAFVMMMPVMGGMNFMWVEHKPESSGESEKRKRERLDSVLRDLSDEDLLRLKERLLDGTIDDEVLYGRMVGDDGELLGERR